MGAPGHAVSCHFGSVVRGRLSGRPSIRARAVAASLLIVCVLGPGRVGAQRLPASPIVVADGRLTVGGSISASFGSSDPGFFNFMDYEHSVLRMLRLEATAALTAGRHLTLLGELRSDNGDGLLPYAFYARVRPWSERAIDIQVGRIPPTFGAFSRRAYDYDNPLIGYPLAYQYLTSLRPDALPASADELLSMRGRGWLSSFSIGSAAADRGVPLASAFRWDTGVQLHAASQLLDGTVSVTTGTLARPLVGDDNGRPQIAGRIAARPAIGLVIGASASHGPFVSAQAARDAVGEGHVGEFTQTAWGVDLEYSRGYYLLRAEAVISRWTLPLVNAPLLSLPLTAGSVSVEGRYKVAPGLYVAARADHLGFSDVNGTNRTATWDAPVTRLEVGGGYSIQRNLLVKAEYQRNSRDGGRVRQLNLGAAQLVFWF